MLKLIIRNGKNFFTREQPNILSASAIMMLILLVTKVLGLLTKTLAVSQLGADSYGIFIAANTLPELLSMLFLFGSITSIVIPVLVEAIHKDDNDSFSSLFSSIINASFISFALLALFVVIAADNVTPFFIEKIAKPTEPLTQEQITQVVDMMRWLLIPQIILGTSCFLSSALNAFKRFVIPQLAPLFYNLGVLFGAIFLIPLLGGSAWGLTWGVLIGSILHFLIQIPLGLHLKIKYRFTIDTTNKKLRQTFFIGLPRMIATAADQIAIAIDRIIAIGLGAAPLGAYHLAVSLVSIPYSLFSSTFSVAALPQLSSEFARKDLPAFRKTFTKVFNQILFLTTPITMIFLVLRVPLVRLLYGIFGKEFSWENTLMVSWAVFFFSLGLIPEVLLAFLNRAFYAIHDTVRPLIVGIFIVVGGISSGILFTNYFSHFNDFSLKLIIWNPSFFLDKERGVAAIGGLALSSSLIYSIGFLFLSILFIKRIGNLNFKNFWLLAFKKLLSGLIMAIFMYWLFKLWEEVLDTARTINVFILLLSTITPGVCVYLWLSYLFKDTEIDIIRKILRMIRKLLLL